jgi:hypothetical protein
VGGGLVVVRGGVDVDVEIWAGRLDVLRVVDAGVGVVRDLGVRRRQVEAAAVVEAQKGDVEKLEL